MCRASQAREVGVGINTLPPAIQELEGLGLLPALDKTGSKAGFSTPEKRVRAKA